MPEGQWRRVSSGLQGRGRLPDDEFSLPCPSSADDLPDPGYEIITPSFLAIPFTLGISTGVEDGTALTPTSLPKGPGQSTHDAEAYGKGSVGKTRRELNHSG